MDMGIPAIGWHGTRKKPSGKHEARWAVPDEKQPGRTKVIGKSFNSIDQARTHASKKANELLNIAVGLSVSKKGVDEALADFLDQNLNPKTLALYERRMREFLSAFPDTPTAPLLPLPKIVYVEQLADDKYITRFDRILEARGCNPGGRHHVLKIVRTFCLYSMSKKRRWLSAYPFEGFKMPSSEFDGRALTDEEYAMVLAPTVGRLNQHALDETDRLLALAFRLGRGMIVRISQVWKLTPSDFREPGEVYIQGIKDQDPEWKPLAGDAVHVMRMLLNMTPAGQRFFAYWPTIEAMRTAVQDKVRRSGVKPTWDDFKKRWVYPRYHDICKVTAVSELAAVPGMSIADLVNITNTSAKTLQSHYIKADKARSHAKYKAYLASRPTVAPIAPQTNGRPTEGGKTAETVVQDGTPAEKSGIGFSHETPLDLEKNTPLDEAI